MKYTYKYIPDSDLTHNRDAGSLQAREWSANWNKSTATWGQIEIYSFISFAISYLGNRGGHWNGSGASGVCDILLCHCSDMFIMIIMLLLQASLRQGPSGAAS